ncbi:hypothetical protein [Rhizobium miluonense]|jgi:hypothetical protein|uniref:Uncharacterized protein n=1 Tax=Rhizobium miluonense TaxID=411945 RepID=A0ABU1SIJ8_9HYPH|nr:hypothetical protein [Rhizobium miluonense]MBB3426479.1 hypothetical protein [Rhizobium sp. BK312]MDR6898822.1 hypothetical protein [Rhizobium miluonense]
MAISPDHNFKDRSLPFDETGPKKSKMPPCGGSGTIDVLHRDVNKTAVLAGARKGLPAKEMRRAAPMAEMPRPDSKLGKTSKSIPQDSRDSCHGVSLTLG